MRRILNLFRQRRSPESRSIGLGKPVSSSPPSENIIDSESYDLELPGCSQNDNKCLELRKTGRRMAGAIVSGHEMVMKSELLDRISKYFKEGALVFLSTHLSDLSPEQLVKIKEKINELPDYQQEEILSLLHDREANRIHRNVEISKSLGSISATISETDQFGVKRRTNYLISDITESLSEIDADRVGKWEHSVILGDRGLDSPFETIDFPENIFNNAQRINSNLSQYLDQAGYSNVFLMRRIIIP